jgi:signal peptide peptidase SppA
MELMRESIFVSALRSFSKMFCAVIGLLLAFLLFSTAYSALSSASLIEEKTTLTIVADADDKRELVSLSAPVILQINIHGPIGMDGPKSVQSDVIQDILIESREGMLTHSRVKGILLHFNTPGGTTTDSDNIYRMLKAYKEKYKVPIFGYVDGLCASGGMYIASSADKLYASPASVIGSVGVIFGPMFNVYETLNKIGVHSRTLTEGIDKDAMSPFRPWKEGEDASFKAMIAFFYQRFVGIVTEARPRLDKEKLVNEYGAKVWDCVQAEKLGYIDVAESNRNEALLALMKEAGVDASKPYQVVELEPKHSWMSQLVAGSSVLLTGKIEHSFDLGQPKIREGFAYLYTYE